MGTGNDQSVYEESRDKFDANATVSLRDRTPNAIRYIEQAAGGLGRVAALKKQRR